MQLDHVAIHNFRCLLDVEFPVSGHSLLVGSNNSGKTCVIDAIRCFYEHDIKFNQTRDFPHLSSSDATSWIEITFTLSEPEWEALPAHYKNSNATQTLRVRKFFVPPKDSDFTANVAYAYRSDGTLSSESFFGAKGVQQGKLGSLIYVPALSRVDEHTKMSGPSALRDLVNNILKSVLSTSDSYAELSTQFDSFSQRIKSETDAGGRCITGIETSLNQGLEGWDAHFSLRFRKPELSDIVKNLIESELIDDSHGSPLKPEQFGAGLQRHLIYRLIRLTSDYAEAPQPKKKQDFSPNLTLLLFEEPEAFLHPPQQEAMWSDLRKIVANSKTWTVLASTHSAHIVSKSGKDLRHIVRLRRFKGAATCHYISDADWAAIVDHNRVVMSLQQEHPNLDFTSQAEELQWGNPDAFEALHYLSWLSADRSSSLFARHVILVEGATEQLLIYRLIEDGRIPGNVHGVYVLDCLGKRNIHRCMRLLSSLGIRHSVIADDDTNKSNTNVIWNDVINRSRTNFTTDIYFVKFNLEHLLGVIPGKASKPYAMIREYESGGLNEASLGSFAQTVSGHLARELDR